MKILGSGRAARRVVGVLAAVSVGVLAMGVGPVSAVAAPNGRATAGVSAILLDAYNSCYAVAYGWADLNANWSKYGSVPVSITTGGHLCEGTFTLVDLEASGADTVILDLTAAVYTLTPDEIQALQTYLEQGHTLLGEANVFQWKSKHIDNGLAPLFGLAEQSTWYKDGLQGMSPTYQLNEQDPDAAVLLRDVNNPYVSSLYGQGQKPAHKKWRANVLAGARYIGLTQDKRNAISVYDGPGYTAIYISSQAAYGSTPDDLQFLYNAIVYPNEG
jgi:hypothetical protein